MPNLHARIINELSLSPCYKALVAELESRRPVVPYWNPVQDNTREMQFASAQQKWHDLMMAIIKP